MNLNLFLFITKCIIPAAVSQTEIKIDKSWASRIDEEVFKTFRYWRISGIDIKRSALKNRKPLKKKEAKNWKDN